MEEEYRIETNFTEFRFSITDKGYDDCGYFWTDAVIAVSNQWFYYKTSQKFLHFSEIIIIRDNLLKLLNDSIASDKKLEFIEPYIQIILKPKYDFRNDKRHIYIKEGYEIRDIIAEFLIYPTFDEVFTDQYYVLPLYREEIEGLVKYLSYMIEKLE